MKRGRAVLLVATIAAALGMSGSASASFHEIKVREVFGGNGNAANDYIELQMFSAGQTLTGGHNIQIYSGAGILNAGHLLTNVGNGANQATILIGDSGVAGTFGVTPDVTVPGLEVSSFTTDGAVCWPDGIPADCVAWHNFPPQGGFPDPASAGPGNNFANSINGATAITRRIDRGCATLLENPLDDVGPSSTDFVASTPNPRNNASPIPEKPCTTGLGNPTSPINPAGNVRKRKCKKKSKSAGAGVAKKKKCKKKKR
jgi:hypothetical protein